MRGGIGRNFSQGQDSTFHPSLFNRKSFQFYLSLLTPQRHILAAALLMTLLQTAAALSPPLIARRIIDDHILPGQMTGIWQWTGLFIALYGISWVFSYYQRFWSQTAGQRVVFQVRNRLFGKMMALPLSFHEKQQKGGLTSLIMNDVNALSSAVTDGVIGMISDLVTLIAMVWILYRLHPVLTLLLGATLPIVLLAMGLLGNRIRRAFRDVREKMAALNSQVEENFSGIRVVQSLGVQAQQEQEFFQVSEGNLQAGVKAMILLALIFPLTSLTTGTGTALLLWYGGLQVLGGTITLGVFVAFLTYLRRFYQPLRNLSDLFNTYLSALASMDRIMMVLETPDVRSDAPLARAVPEPAQGKIVFDHVSFSYHSGDETVTAALKDICLTIEPGEHLGIAGATGAGKSTLASLLAGLMDPSSGDIRLDDVPLSSIPRDQLHRLIAVIPQQVFLYTGSVYENIAFGKPGASLQEVMETANKTKAHDMIMGLPQGYQTVIGEEGTGLSGGQRQLIAYTRAMMKNAPILILDEATASMDVTLEAQVQSSLALLLQERTALIIAHRLSTIRGMDRICILNQGSLAACGTHEELAKSNLYYQELLASGFSPQ